MNIKIDWKLIGLHSDLFPRSWCRIGQSEFCSTAGTIRRMIVIDEVIKGRVVIGNDVPNNFETLVKGRRAR